MTLGGVGVADKIQCEWRKAVIASGSSPQRRIGLHSYLSNKHAAPEGCTVGRGTLQLGGQPQGEDMCLRPGTVVQPIQQHLGLPLERSHILLQYIITFPWVQTVGRCNSAQTDSGTPMCAKQQLRPHKVCSEELLGHRVNLRI